MKRSFVKFSAGALIAMTAIFAQNFNVYSQGDGDDSGVVCKCNLLGRCKASGSKAVCAEGNPNVQCQDYNGNCGIH